MSSQCVDCGKPLKPWHVFVCNRCRKAKMHAVKVRDRTARAASEAAKKRKKK